MTDPDPELAPDASAPGLSRPQRFVLLAIVAVLVLSVAARAFVGGGPPDQPPDDVGSSSSAVPAGGSGLVGGGHTLPGTGGTATTAPEPEGLEAYLPYLTEGSFFALIGFALGFATKKAAKLALIGVALLFAVLQGLSYAGVASIDWGRAVELLNELVFNLKQDQTFTEILKDKLPTTGGFLAGFLFGFQRG